MFPFFLCPSLPAEFPSIETFVRPFAILKATLRSFIYTIRLFIPSLQVYFPSIAYILGSLTLTIHTHHIFFRALQLLRSSPKHIIPALDVFTSAVLTTIKTKGTNVIRAFKFIPMIEEL